MEMKVWYSVEYMTKMFILNCAKKEKTKIFLSTLEAVQFFKVKRHLKMY